MNSFKAIKSRLDYTRSDTQWIKFIHTKITNQMATDFDRHVRTLSPQEQMQCVHDLDTFARALASSRNSAILRDGSNVPELKFNAHNNASPEDRALQDQSCPKAECKLRGCPHSFDNSKECDVMGTPNKWRLSRLETRENYRELVDERRAAANRPLLFPELAKGGKGGNLPLPPPQNSSHANKIENDDAMTPEEIQAMVDSVNEQFDLPATAPPSGN